MYERIIEIIVFVIAQLRQNVELHEVDTDKLQRLGYTKSEISTAFSWIADRSESGQPMLEFSELADSNSFRILHEAEQELFTPEAWGELVQMNSLGILNNEYTEILIEKAVLMGSQEIDSEQLKTFVANIIFNAQTDSLPGVRFLLQGNESIN
jgi:uncharacterized protein Smg (DUF494 family)